MESSWGYLAEYLCDEEAVCEVHAGVPDGVGEVQHVEPLQQFAGEGGAATEGVEHMLYYYEAIKVV